MLHELFQLERPLIILDTETTGVDVQTARIVELGFQFWTAQGMEKEWRSYINPGIPIPPDVSDVHGITDKHLRECRRCGQEQDAHGDDHEFQPVPTFKQLASNLAKGFSHCDYAGKNVRFDLRILTAEMKRAGVAWTYDGAYIIDAERLEQLAVPRTLSDLYEKYTGSKHDGAHGALSDVRASTEVIIKQLQTHAKLPRSITQLHELQWPGWLCNGGEFRVINGTAVCQFGKHRGKPMKSIPIDYWDWILSTDFPSDVKALASAAKLGQFPELK